MVNRKNIGYRQDLVLCAEDASGAERAVPGPLHGKTDVLAVLSQGSSSVVLWTDECGKDVTYKLEWEIVDVHYLLGEAVVRGRFLGSEWCAQRPMGPVAACDAYSIVREEWNQYARRDLRSEYYVKFALSRTGKSILVASCHLSRHRGNR